MKQLVGLGSVLGVALALAPAAHASLILQGLTPITGAGLGSEPTILTIQSTGNATTETGCVSFNNILGASMTGAGVCTGSSGDVKTGSSQTGTVLLSAIGSGTVNASTFSVIFNADQPAAAQNGAPAPAPAAATAADREEREARAAASLARSGAIADARWKSSAYASFSTP